MAARDDDLAIDLRRVTKVYKGRRKVQALSGIEMRVERGEIFGLLGPNGAGKSTLVKIMMTVVRPTEAEGTVLGQPIGHKPTLARIGYLPEKHRFPMYLSGRQVVDFFGALSGVDRRTRKKRVDELIELVGLKDAADRRINTYSKGMAQRVGLAQALVNDPDLVILDEPTDGVDPVGRREILDLMSALRERGKTVFVNSHLLSELEGISDRVAILLNGAAGSVAAGTWGLLREAMAGSLEDAAASGDGKDKDRGKGTGADTARGPTGPVKPLRGQLRDGPWVELHTSPVSPWHVLRVGTTDPAEVQPVLDAVRRRGLVVARLQPVRPTLENLFMEAVGAPTSPPPMPAMFGRPPGAPGFPVGGMPPPPAAPLPPGPMGGRRP
jgi:ABC-2 type transport system ATP-binding protein